MTISLAFLALNPVKAAVEGRLPAALASSGSAIRRLNGAGSLRRSASNRNSCSAAKDLELQQRKRPIYGGLVQSDFTLKAGRRERNFWMRRQGAKNRHR